MTQTIVVTGAGTGIGQAIAKNLASRHYGLLLLGRTESTLKATCDSLENPDTHQYFPCDIRKKEDIRKALAASGVKEIFALVANAGVGGENHYHEGDRWNEIIDTNLTGTYNTVQECLPYLKNSSAEFKKIVIVSSILARLGVPGYTGYCASKAGLLGLMRSLASQLTADKILVNAICPGWVNTAMAQEGLETFAQALNISKEEALKQAMTQIPLGKMSEPEEVAQMIYFLISDAQNSLTGQTIDLNNGALMP